MEVLGFGVYVFKAGKGLVLVLGFTLLGLVGLLWFRLRARLWDCKVWSLEPFGIRPSSFGILYQQLGVS